MIHGRARARLGLFALAWTLIASAHPTPALCQIEPDSAAIPAFVGFVNDAAQVMSESERAKLEAFLDQVQRKTGAELAVLTVPTTKPDDPMDYKVRVFERWGLGKRGEDNGLLMLVAIEERQVRFETGYGLEGALPDGLQSRIVRDVMRPLLREGRTGEGITQGMLASAARIAAEKGVTLEWDGRELRYSRGGSKLSRAELVMLMLVVVVMVIVIAVRMQGFRGGGPGGWGTLRDLQRGGRGGWIGPGGGWGGGMGGFGGGGGGGPTFGGFGGGSSGGGGGGGSW